MVLRRYHRYWKENFPHAYEAIYGNYQNNVLANIIFVDFQQQGERGLTNAPDEDPDDLSTGYYGSAYRSPENWTTALRSSHFSAAARRGLFLTVCRSNFAVLARKVSVH